jgi:hypothetical protein
MKVILLTLLAVALAKRGDPDVWVPNSDVQVLTPGNVSLLHEGEWVVEM